MPEAGGKQRNQDHPTRDIERLPERRLDHRDEKSRKKKRHGRKDGPLPFHVFPAIGFQDLIDDAVPSRLRGDVASALRVRII